MILVPFAGSYLCYFEAYWLDKIWTESEKAASETRRRAEEERRREEEALIN